MTFIQPTKHANILNLVIAIMVITILGGTFWLVVAYNKTVDMSQDIVSIKAELNTIGANTTALNNSVISTLGSSDFQTVALQDDLVQDKNPEYYQIDENGLSLLNNR